MGGKPGTKTPEKVPRRIFPGGLAGFAVGSGMEGYYQIDRKPNNILLEIHYKTQSHWIGFVTIAETRFSPR